MAYTMCLLPEIEQQEIFDLIKWKAILQTEQHQTSCNSNKKNDIVCPKPLKSCKEGISISKKGKIFPAST